jgi:hypothetical protein
VEQHVFLSDKESGHGTARRCTRPRRGVRAAAGGVQQCSIRQAMASAPRRETVRAYIQDGMESIDGPVEIC